MCFQDLRFRNRLHDDVLKNVQLFVFGWVSSNVRNLNFNSLKFKLTFELVR